MVKTFEDIRGNVNELPNPRDIELDCAQDIVTDEITSYYVILEGEYKYEVNKATYEAIEKYIG